MAEKRDSNNVNPSEAETLGSAGGNPPLSPTDDTSDSLPSSTEIDNYRLIQKVAEGGMGEVYEAEQLSPVRRRVAVKVIKLGMDTRRFVARFESERQALAVMDHSNIARIFDAGATRSGRPYFSMEFVRGIPITEYCDRQKLDTPERLELFLAVLDGVQHAHQKGIIHRDLKPSNILVATEGEKPVPKIIDFGLAKATGPNLTEPTTFTQFGQAVGTPAYMSPEQITMDASGIDTRTDVYALGVLLYELLVGALPFSLSQSPDGGFDEIRRRVCEEDPSRPSARLRSMGDTTAEIARRRGTNSAVLFRQLEGDLDWIVLKALEKDRNRRYPSVSGLAADVRRHLTDQPVVARPPSASYRIGKFVRRHRIGVSAAALAGLALLVGSTLATIGLIRASRAEEEARLEAETANQVTEFLIELYQVSDPSEARGSSVTARELLDKGAERIRRELEGQPLVRTRLLFAIGRVYQALGLYPQARDLMDLSLDSASAADPEGVNVHPILLALGRLARQQGRTDDAFEFARESEALTESRFGARSAERAASLQLLGELYRDDADYDEAERLLNEALNISEEASGPDHITVGWILYHLGWLHQLRAEYEEALPVYDRALRIAERNLTEEDPLFGYFLNDVGTLHSALGDYAAAEESYRRALAVREIALEELHPAIADTLNNIGSALWFQGKMAEAEDYYRRALEIRREALGPEHPQVAGSLNNLALVYRSVGNLEDARPLYEEALEIREATAGPDHPDTAGVLSNLGGLLARVGDYDEAESMLNRALAINEATFGATHPDVGNVLVQLSFLHSRRGALVEARRATERALEIRESALGPNHTEVASLLTTLGALTSSGEPVQRAIGIYEDTGSDQVAAALWELAWLNESQGNPEAAKESADRAQEYLLDVQGESAAGWAYDSARTDGLAGFSDLALYKLRQAVELGFSATGVAEDEAFATLVGRPEFEDVAAVLAGRVRP